MGRPGADVDPPGREDVSIHGSSIPLGPFLKYALAVDSGGQAKRLVQAGQVLVNGEIELRRRRQLSIGDTVQLADGRAFRVDGGGSRD